MNVMMEKKNAKEFQSSVAKLLNKQITAPRQKSKKVKIYKNGDNSFEGLELIISMDQFKSMQAFLDDISKKIGLTTCAKKLYTLNGELIQSMEQIDDNKEYVAATNIFIPLLYGEMKFITNSDRISRKNSGNSIKMAASRNSRSVDLKKERRKENTAQRKSKSSAPSQNTQSIGNITSKDKKKKTTKVQKEHTVAAIAVSDLSQSTKKAVAKFASTSSTSTTIPTIKRSNVAKMTVKMNPTPLVISEGMSKQSSLSAGQRPSTTSIKNRVPTPKPAAKILKSNENSNDDEDSTNEQS